MAAGIGLGVGLGWPLALKSACPFSISCFPYGLPLMLEISVIFFLSGHRDFQPGNSDFQLRLK